MKYPKHLIMKTNSNGKVITITPDNWEKYKSNLTLNDRRLYKEYFKPAYIPKWLN